jgi:hypothetical protein
MVSVWPEPPSAKPAEPSAGACDGQEALALCTSDTPNHNSEASSFSGAVQSRDVCRRYAEAAPHGFFVGRDCRKLPPLKDYRHPIFAYMWGISCAGKAVSLRYLA